MYLLLFGFQVPLSIIWAPTDGHGVAAGIAFLPAKQVLRLPTQGAPQVSPKTIIVFDFTHVPDFLG